MAEPLAALCKAAGQFSLAWLIGGTLFLWLAGASRDPVFQQWKSNAIRLFPVAATLLLVASAIGLLAQAAITAELSLSGLLTEQEQLRAYLLETRAGRLSGIELAGAAPLLVITLLHARAQNRLTGTGVLLFTILIAALGPLTGHTAGSEAAMWLTPVHMAHVLAISAWLGGLPAWIWLVTTTGPSPAPERRAYAVAALGRFSTLAIICILIIIVTGIILSLEFTEGQGDLLGTPYGLLICAKLILLAGVLAIAYHARTRLLPGLADPAREAGFYFHAARWIALELALAGIVLGLGSILSQTTPALHDQPVWLLPFRLSIAATWPVAPTPRVVSASVISALIAGVLLALSYKKMLRWQISTLAAVASLGGGIALWQISVPAWPGSFRRSEVPYLTVSIANGMTQFQHHCTGCHGAGGLGDGPDAATLPKPPADLSAPHTALHTGGDMFWWLTHGMPDGGMPGFADSLSEQDRWDVINFLRAFSQGYQARVLSPEIAPRKPWLGAPDFYFENAALQDFRGVSNVLLVFSSDDAKSMARLGALTQAREKLRGSGLEILTVADKETRHSYELLSRTLSNRGDTKSVGFARRHMEFLIDRFGYIRARWIPEDEATGWQEIEKLRGISQALNAEPQILPPPADHLH